MGESENRVSLLSELGHDTQDTITQYLQLGSKSLALQVTPPDADTGTFGFGVGLIHEKNAQGRFDGITISDVMQAIGGDAFDALPGQLSTLDSIALYQMNGASSSAGLEALHVSFGFTAAIDLIPGFLSLDGLAAAIDGERLVEEDRDGPMIWDAEVSARLHLGPPDARLSLDLHGEIIGLGASAIEAPSQEDIDAALKEIATEFGSGLASSLAVTFDEVEAAREKGPSFVFEGALEHSYPLKKLADHFGFVLPDIFENVAIDGLEFGYNGVQESAHFLIDIGLDIEVVEGSGVVLRDVSLEVEGAERGALDCTIFAAFEIDQHVAIDVSAARRADGSWMLRGHASDIEMSEIIAAMQSATKSESTPDELNKLTLSHVDLELDLGAKHIRMHCTGDFAIGETLEECTLTLELSFGDGGYVLEVMGGLSVSLEKPNDHATPAERHEEPRKLQFDLMLHRDSDGTLLTASYDGEGAGEIDVLALLSTIAPEIVPPRKPEDGALSEFKIEVPRAGFAIDGSDDGGTLAGIAFRGSLDLSNVHLPGMGGGGFPLIGELDLAALSGASGPASLSMDLLYGTKPQTPESAGFSMLSDMGFEMPSDWKGQGATVSATLALGEIRETLALPSHFDADKPDTLTKVPGNGQETAEDADGKKTTVQTSNGDVKWLTVHKSFGPLHIERLGIGLDLKTQIVTGHVEAAVSAAGLTVSLDGLTVSAPINNLTAPTFGLSGLGVAFAAQSISVSGALLSRDMKIEVEGKQLDRTGYAGTATVTTDAFSLSAMGAFVEITEGVPSMMLYAVLDYPIGGPGFFFVTGLAGGFGYNRSVLVPDLDEIESFPLIEEVLGRRADSGNPDPMAALFHLDQVLPPRAGAQFLAVGVKFTSFKIIDSFALAIARMDHGFEFDLLGISTIQSPPQTKSAGKPIAKIRIAWAARFLPDLGEISLRAKVLPGAYCLSEKAHLTGEFAFFAWMKDQKDRGIEAGDFVVTVGGYHKDFHLPSHYPRVSRLELNWRVNNNLTIKGNAYFALASHAVMAGGMLDATWKQGDVSAHFVAHADMLICWEPNHYQAEIGVRIDARATIHFFGTHHVSLHADAQLRIWGPEFGGHAHVNVKIIGISFSFDMDFGNKSNQLHAISWQAFQSSFIPSDPFTFQIEGGLERNSECGGLVLPDGKASGQTRIATVNAAELQLSLKSAFAATKGQDEVDDRAAVGIPAMGIASGAYDSRLTVTVKKRLASGAFVTVKLIENDAGEIEAALKAVEKREVQEEVLVLEALSDPLPAALWGNCLPVEINKVRLTSRPKLNEADRIKGSLTGFRLRGLPQGQEHDTGNFIPVDAQFSTHAKEKPVGWQEISAFSAALGAGEDPGQWITRSPTAGQRQILDGLMVAGVNS